MLEKFAESIDSGIEMLVQRNHETAGALQGIEAAVDYVEQVAVMTAKTVLNAESISVDTTENTAQHDDLHVHPERREAEIESLNNSYNGSPVVAKDPEMHDLETDALRRLAAIHGENE